MPQPLLHGRAVVCAASGSVLSPRQRKLAAKRKQKQEQKSTSTAPQQGPYEHQDGKGPIISLRKTAQKPLQEEAHTLVGALQEQHLPDSITSLQDIIQQQLQPDLQTSRVLSQQLQALSPSQLIQLISLWAQEARNMTAEDLTAGTVILECYLTHYKHAALEQLRQAQLSRQQLADIAWGLAHFDTLEWRCQQQQQHQHSPQQQQQQQPCCLPLRWCGSFQSALQVPFLVLPNVMPHLHIDDVVSEVALARDIIYLSDDNGGVKAVPETRLTGWQSDIGAMFCYSGKEMVPSGPELTHKCAEGRDVLARVTGETFDSLLINYYQDGKCGMRYHVDPLYGKWTPSTAVVSLGATRQFVFRRIDDHSVRWSYRVSNGDVVVMHGDCQETLQHAVKVEAAATDAGPRVSLVYKQRIQLPDGSWA